MAPLAPATAILADNDDIAEPQQTPTIRDACELEQSLAEKEEQATFMARVIAAMNGLSNSGASSGSVSGSGSSLGSHKPPKPPSCSQARKQLRLLPKQREQSPVLSNGHATASNASTTRHHTPHKTSSSSSSSSAVQQLSQSLSNGNYEEHNESHYEISLKLPVSTAGTGAASSSSVPDAAADRLRLLTRSPSPAYSISSRCSSTQSSRCSTRTTSRCLETPPRRIFPQTYTRGSGLDAYEMRQLESSPVVFDANLSFVLGCKRQPVHQSVRPTPSYEDPRTSSAYLSEKIQNFLKRTDHVQEEWTAMGRRTRRHNHIGGGGSSTTSLGNSRCSTPSGYDDYDTISLIERQRERNSMERCGSVGRTRSSQNILTKAFQLSKQLPHTPTSRGNSMARESSVAHSATASVSALNGVDDVDDDDRTIREEDDNELDEVCLVDLENYEKLLSIFVDTLEFGNVGLIGYDRLID